MFRKYFKMKEKPSSKLFDEYEEFVKPSAKIRSGLIDSFIFKWSVVLPLVHDDTGEQETTVVGFEVPIGLLITPEWANSITFDGGGRTFWKPNTSTEKGLEFDNDLKIINSHQVITFTTYVVAEFIGLGSSIIDEGGNTHISVAGRVGDVTIMSVPIPISDDTVKLNRVGFTEIIEGEFVSIIAAAGGL